MRVIHITDQLLAAGRSAFEKYSLAMIAGPEAPSFEAAFDRQTGLTVVPGAIMACLERGITRELDIICAVARISRCRRVTVEAVLRGLTGSDPAVHLWSRDRGAYSALRSSSHPAASLIAA
jgi:hypothetical protein